jgi:hypothetical protein
MPVILAWAVGAAALALVGRLLVSEWDRVNGELHGSPRPDPVRASEREAIPTLVRDPVTGEYRPKG